MLLHNTMTETFSSKLISRLDRFESNKLLPYDDKHGDVVFVPGMTLEGNLSISRGYNLNSGITARVSDYITEDKIMEFTMVLLGLFAEFSYYSEARRLALMDMIYHMGPTRFRGFKRMIKAIHDGKWGNVADELLDSAYGRDPRFTVRSHENADMLRDG